MIDRHTTTSSEHSGPVAKKDDSWLPRPDEPEILVGHFIDYSFFNVDDQKLLVSLHGTREGRVVTLPQVDYSVKIFFITGLSDTIKGLY